MHKVDSHEYFKELLDNIQSHRAIAKPITMTSSMQHQKQRLRDLA